jgi:hypothetical protein
MNDGFTPEPGTRLTDAGPRAGQMDARSDRKSDAPGIKSSRGFLSVETTLLGAEYVRQRRLEQNGEDY